MVYCTTQGSKCFFDFIEILNNLLFGRVIHIDAIQFHMQILIFVYKSKCIISHFFTVCGGVNCKLLIEGTLEYVVINLVCVGTDIVDEIKQFFIPIKLSKLFS